MSFLQRILGRERRDRQMVALSDPYLGGFVHRPAGAHVGPHRASGTSVAYACVAVISQSLAACRCASIGERMLAVVTGPPTIRTSPCSTTSPRTG